MSDFIDYFINDEYSLKQVLHHISLKPSNESALMKCTSLDSTQALHSNGTLRYDEASGQNSYSTELVEYTNTREPTYCRMVNDESLELYERLIGVTNIDEISKDIDNELSGHYCKINQYQSFFIDVTKLLINMPKLGYDLMASPQVILNMLDHVIIPILYSMVENICIQYNVSDVSSVTKFYRTIPCHLSYMFRSKNVSNILQNALDRLDINNMGIYANNFSNNKPFKFNITTRLKNVVPTADVWRQSVNEIQDDDVGHMITVTATVILTGVMNVLEEEREYVCKKCNKSFICKSLPESNFFVNIPVKCPNFTGLSGNNGQKCDGTLFVKGIYNRRSDYQEIRCQSVFNPTNYMNVNSIMPAVLRREIAGTCFPGDIVHMVAFVRRRWKKLKRGERCDSEIFLDVINLDIVNWKSLNSVNVCEVFKANLYERFWSVNRYYEVNARNSIIDGFCPSLVDLDNAKLALILTIIGGFSVDSVLEECKDNRWSKYADKRNELKISLNSSSSKDGCSVKKKKGSRTQCHILFVGDPGTGKSQLLKHAGNLSFKHVSVSGTNCTSVGLTCTLVRDGPEVMLAAGALVLAAGGVCSIDEFSSIRAEDKSCLHEAMEQQIISVAKAGIKCTLNCQCTIVAASNVKFSKNKSISSVIGREVGSSFDNTKILNINVPLPLLSRFDLIMVFTDNSTNDIDLTEFLLSEPTKQKVVYDEHDQPILDWSVGSTVKDYVNFVKENIFPSLTSSSKALIDSYYMELRKCSMESKYGGGPTVRTIESLVRLSQAHARLMFRNIVTLFDIVSVIWILEFGLQGFSIGCNNGNEQILDRQGLFPNIKQIFNSYTEDTSDESLIFIGNKRICYKITNGIQTEGMYDFFESLLLSRLSLKKVKSRLEEDGIALIPEGENQAY
ncbi:DNA replication licensing factor family member [Theileria equi strain WA]|uniref:DNA replication licensing factor family member n=1 Tax=Theileria equi strain WA TaxID=1537102 RepID=L0B2H6_THEEQ|nr:DNA replication licensing factor family member [Theileria equi strain WA]AFZ81411.1 DNA replication licensing factor family member [Theileria equi strain WA]|eukprot:XP_004831077.1 DNA replication licensing factor family member [Theileria equi strain WA]